MAAILIGGLTATIVDIPVSDSPIFLNVNSTTINIANDKLVELTHDTTMPRLDVNNSVSNLAYQKPLILQDIRQVAGGVLEQWE